MRPATDAADRVPRVPSPGDGLVCRGVLRRRGNASAAATIEPQRCDGCRGRCAIRIGSARLRLELDDLPDGTPVEFVAAPRALAGRALFVFGSPLAATALAVLAGAHDWLLPCAFAVGLMLALGARFAWPRAEPDVEVQAQPCRVRIHLA